MLALKLFLTGRSGLGTGMPLDTVARTSVRDIAGKSTWGRLFNVQQFKLKLYPNGAYWAFISTRARRDTTSVRNVCDTASRHAKATHSFFPVLSNLIPRCDHSQQVTPSSVVKAPFLRHATMLTINGSNVGDHVWVDESGVCGCE